MLLGDEVDVEAGFEEKSVAVNEAEDDELGDDSLLDRVIQLLHPSRNSGNDIQSPLSIYILQSGLFLQRSYELTRKELLSSGT